jgi:predicted dehydrogenase
VRCFQATGRADVSFVETDEARRAAISEKYSAPGFADVGAAGRNWDQAVVATPAHLHIDIAASLAEQRVHLLIEKPLSTNTKGIERLARIAKDRNIVIAIAYIYRCFPAIEAMRAALVAGRFGKPLQLVSVAGQHFPTYRPAYRDTYYADRACGGGAIQDALTHLINVGEWLVGPLDRLVADAAHRGLDGVDVEDTTHVIGRHGSVLGSYSLNQYQSPNENTMTVICERGAARWEVHAHRWRWMIDPDEPWHDEPHAPQLHDTPYLTQANRFLDAVEGKYSGPLCTLDEGAQTLRATLAALASVESGRWQTIADRL